MKLDPQSIEAQLLRLPARDRARLAEMLLASLEGAEPGVESAWAEEAERRYRELASGEVAGVPAEEVFAELDSRYRG